MADEIVNEVILSGPLFDGRVDEEVLAAQIAVIQAVADHGVEVVRQEFGGSIQQSSGKFLNSIRTTPQTRTYTISTRHRAYSMVVPVPKGAMAITTSRADYGPWLEGVGSRNTTSTFKGYRGFERGAADLVAQADEVANAAAAPFIAAMNL